MFVAGLIVGLFVGAAALITYLLCAAGAKAKRDDGEQVDEWGKPDWVGKEMRK